MTRSKTTLKIVQPDLDQLEAVVTEAASQTAPVSSRLASHRNELQLRANGLVRERQELTDRLTLLRAQFSAAEAGLTMHIEDIDATLALYPSAAE